MSATRLLVLGVVRGYGRAHGYLVRSELLSWGIEEWADVQWGSVYSEMEQAAKDRLLSAAEIGRWPGRVDYELTARGDAEFFRLLREALRAPDRGPDMLAAGLALLPALTRIEASSLLKERLTRLEAARGEAAERAERARDREVPAHVHELFALRVHAADSGVAWTRGLIERLEGGAYHPMAGEADVAFGAPGEWTVPPPANPLYPRSAAPGLEEL
jgi:DNA-binding PadR family transcriptional regulator